MRICIVGAGIAGLAVAWHLVDPASKSDADQVVLVEAEHVGGNAQTRSFFLGDTARWADLGVNDFNANTYLEVVAAMNLLGVEYKPLEDTACFFTADGSVTYTLGGPRQFAISGDMARQFQHFRMHAPGDLKANWSELRTCTIRAYLDSKTEYTEQFKHDCILARVNAMYFCADAGPEETPLQSVLSYYSLQEGFGTSLPPARQYFVNGAQRWMRALADACVNGGARIFENTGHATVSRDSAGLRVTARSLPSQEPFDAVVLATHADAAARAATAVATPKQLRVLRRIKYTKSTCYVHADARLLPPNRNAYRTFNIRIRDEHETKTNYEMTYVENRHQNDSTSIFDHFGLAEYFVSLDPYRAPADVLVLADERGKPIVRDFYHNLVDLETLQAQDDLRSLQGKGGLYFAGGWTHGAGLHIECWVQAQHVASNLKKARNTLRRVAPGGPAPGPDEPKVPALTPLGEAMPHYFARSLPEAEERARVKTSKKNRA